MRLRGCDFYLIELKLDGSLTAKHGNHHADAVFVDLNGFHSTGEGTEGTVENADGVANRVVDNDLALFNAHCVHFFFGEGDGIVTCGADKAGNTAHTADSVPCIVAVYHLNKDITGIQLAVVGFAYARLGDLSNSLHGNGNGQDLILQATALHRLFDGGLDRVFVSGVEKNTYNHNLISNVIEFAKGNAIRTCLEGVESTKELVILEMLLPDVIQGYLFDKPNPPDVIERTYIDSTAKEYKQRTDFVNKLYEYKEKMGIVHFDPKDILRENEVGLWKLRINSAENHYEFHIDDTMEKTLAIDKKYTPKECYDYWYSNIHPDYYSYVEENLNKIINSDTAAQIEFVWKHEKLGDVMVRLSGKRVSSLDGMVVLEGYHRIITDVASK